MVLTAIDVDVDNRLMLRIETDKMKEVPFVLNMAKRLKSPVVSFGGVNQFGAWIWIKIPLRVGDLSTMGVDNNVVDR